MLKKFRFPLRPFKQLLKERDIRSSYGAVELFEQITEDLALRIAIDSKKLAKHAGRKTVKAEDVKLASERFTKLL